MKYVPLCSVPTKTRYDIYSFGKFEFSTFSEGIAHGEYMMGSTIKTIKVAK